MKAVLFLLVALAAGSAQAQCVKIAPIAGQFKDLRKIRNPSFQNPACLPGGKIAITVWYNGYNGSEKTEDADIYVLDHQTPGALAKRLGDAHTNKVNYTGHITRKNAAGVDQITFSCDGNSLCISDLDGANMCKIEAHQGSYQEPVFSPDGKFIAFERVFNREGDNQICTVPVNHTGGANCGSGKFDCPKVAGYNKQPDWSPLGGLVVYQSKQKGVDWQLYTMKVNAQGMLDGHPLQITGDEDSATDASFSPNGKRIIYSAGEDIPSIDVDGAKRLKLKGLPSGYNGAVAWCGSYVFIEHSASEDPDKTNEPTSIYRCPNTF